MTAVHPALPEVDACLAALGHGRPIRDALKITDEQLAAIQERLGVALDLEGELTVGIMAEWTPRAREALAGLDDVLEAAGGDVDAVVAALGEEFKGIGKVLEPLVSDKVGVAYDTERVAVMRSGAISEAASFDVVDVAAKEWLDKDTVYWVDNAYDRVIGKRVATVVSDVAVEQGLGTRAAAQALREQLPPELLGKKPRGYFEVVASSATTRARTFGAIASFEQANIASAQYISVLDQVTSRICRELDGRVYRVEVLTELRDRMLEADSPEAAKEIMPWVPASSLQGKATEQLEAEGAIVPPAHGRCRSSLDIFVSEGTVNQTAGPQAAPETTGAWGAYSERELANKLKPITTNPPALTAAIDADLSTAQVAKARQAVATRSAVVGTFPDAKVGRRMGFWDESAGVRAELDEAGLIWAVEEMGAGDVAARLAADRATGVSMALEGL